MSSNENFELTSNELKDLMQTKSPEAEQKLKSSFGGTSGLAAKLKSNLTTGLSGQQDDLNRRMATFGKNEIPPKPPKSFLSLALGALQDPTLIMLMICSFISIGLSFYNPNVETINKESENSTTTQTLPLVSDIKENSFSRRNGSGSGSETNLEWIEGVAILVAVCVVVFVTALNDWKKERQFRSLKKQIEKDNRASVIRNKEIVQIGIDEIVVGDICCIKYGDMIPADGVVVQSDDLKVDESSLTGETDLIKKSAETNVILLSGLNFDLTLKDLYFLFFISFYIVAK